jgi:hypothetical protein
MATVVNRRHIAYTACMSQYYIGFEVFTAVVMKSIIFWDMTPCSQLGCNGLHGVISQKMILFNKILRLQVAVTNIRDCEKDEISNYMLTGMAQSVQRLRCRPDDRRIVVQFRAGARDLPLPPSVNTGYGVHSAC